MSHKELHPSLRIAAVALFLLAVAAVAVSYRVGRAGAAPSVRPGLVYTVLEPACPSSITAGTSYTKIADLGTFEVQSADSVVETTFYGRVYASSTDGSGLQYELRVDDAASSVGRIRAVLKAGEVGSGVGRAVSMGGFFEGLSESTHTVSLWARVANGTTASTVMYDPGCWSSDHVVIKEYLPFGTVALPTVLNQ